VYADVYFFDFARGLRGVGWGGIRLLPEPVLSRDFISRLGCSVLGVDVPVSVRERDDGTVVGEIVFSSLVTASLMDRRPVTFALAEEKKPRLAEGLGVALSLDASLAASSSLVGLAAIALRDDCLLMGSNLVTTGVIGLRDEAGVLMAPGVVADR